MSMISQYTLEKTSYNSYYNDQYIVTPSYKEAEIIVFCLCTELNWGFNNYSFLVSKTHTL